MLPERCRHLAIEQSKGFSRLWPEEYSLVATKYSLVVTAYSLVTTENSLAAAKYSRPTIRKKFDAREWAGVADEQAFEAVGYYHVPDELGATSKKGSSYVNHN